LAAEAHKFRLKRNQRRREVSDKQSWTLRSRFTPEKANKKGRRIVVNSDVPEGACAPLTRNLFLRGGELITLEKGQRIGCRSKQSGKGEEGGYLCSRQAGPEEEKQALFDVLKQSRR